MLQGILIVHEINHQLQQHRTCHFYEDGSLHVFFIRNWDHSTKSFLIQHEILSILVPKVS